MRRLLLVVGIVLILAGVIALLFCVLQRHGYYHLLDGDAELYSRLRWRMIFSFILGIVLTAIGAVCLITRTKM